MEYKREKTIEISSWIITSLLLVKFIPKDKYKIREATLAFLFKQVITWLFGLLVVEKDNISYPYRLFFKKANKSSFTFEYFVYPGICALFNVYYPEKKSNTIRFLYNLFFTSFITFFEVLALKYTKLIQYQKWTWYWSFITIWITNYCARIFHRWFFSIKSTKKTGFL